MRFVTVVVYYILLVYCKVEATCPTNAFTGNRNFGPECRYMCHCRGKAVCNETTGECPEQCQPGWMGTACQYINIAYRKEARTTSSLENALVDGDIDTCVPSPANVLKVNLKKRYPVYGVSLVVQGSTIVEDAAWVYLIDYNQNKFKCNYFAADVDTGGNIATFVCNRRGLPVQYIEIYIYDNEDDHILCEIEVNAGRNIVYKQHASQYYTNYGATANRAVDGGINGGDYHKYPETCTHTPEDRRNPWWRVRLPSRFYFTWARIYNRVDKDWDIRLANFKIYASNSSNFNNKKKFVYDFRGHFAWNVVEYVLVDINQMSATNLEVILEGNSKTLTICELEVFGDCPLGMCGLKCDTGCHCKHPTLVDPISVTCAGGCSAGWTGQNNRCDEICPEGTFGTDCLQDCGNCLDGTCDLQNGTCQNELCQPGWLGPLCNQTCMKNTFGENCTGVCGQCARGTCSPVNGICLEGDCQEGWQGIYCNKTCSPGQYGKNCNKNCGKCADGLKSCDSVFGYCPNSTCTPGWQGPRCDVCSEGKFGVDCLQDCGNCLHDTCDAQNGTCQNGLCQSGWREPFCNQKTSDSSDGDTESITGGGSAGVAVGSVLAVLVVIAIIIIVICIILRRRRGAPVKYKQESRKSSDRPRESTVYANPCFDDIGGGAVEEETYYNESVQLPEGAVQLSTLWDYVQERLSDPKSLKQEFESLPAGMKYPATVATFPENIQKNRYKQLYAYDHSRVELSVMAEDETDYINANFIDGFSKSKAFIASQGATKHNIDDLWRMVWQYNCGKIVMLTNLTERGQMKSLQYWPDEGQQQFGKIMVHLVKTDVYADFTIRTIRIENNTEQGTKELRHFHYTAWPDKGVPEFASSVVQFWDKVKREPGDGPIVVHCSAGIGRTGTFIALDYLVEQGRTVGYVCFKRCVEALREQRVNMVQVMEQYIFLHEAVVEALMLSGTAIPSAEFHKAYSILQEADPREGKKKLLMEFEKLQHEFFPDNVYAEIVDTEDASAQKDEYAGARSEENKEKNRYSNILASDKYRPYLTTADGATNYINAVFLPTHRNRFGFLITQMPLPSTVGDFLRLVCERQVQTVVMFDDVCPSDQELGVYWPSEEPLVVGTFYLTLLEEHKGRGFVTRDIRLQNKSTGDETTFRQFTFDFWKADATVPEDAMPLLSLFASVQEWQSSTNPIIVHCLNGAERSGLYCVLSTVIERLNVEQDVAIKQTVKMMRQRRQQIIPNFEQYEFCHEAVLEYLRSFEEYANFT